MLIVYLGVQAFSGYREVPKLVALQALLIVLHHLRQRKKTHLSSTITYVQSFVDGLYLPDKVSSCYSLLGL